MYILSRVSQHFEKFPSIKCSSGVRYGYALSEIIIKTVSKIIIKMSIHHLSPDLIDQHSSCSYVSHYIHRIMVRTIKLE